MKPITLFLLMAISLPLHPAIRFYEPKIVRETCSQKTYNALCVPRVKHVQNDKVNWI